jgi:gastrin-releasing peptide receptor
MDIYRTDAAIWNQTQTTTDRQHHYSGAAYRQMAGTYHPKRYTNMSSKFHNEINVSLENLVSAFNTASYVGKCSNLLYHILAHQFLYIPYNGEFPQELITTAWDLHGKFNTFIQTAFWFICTGKTVEGLDINTMSRIYVHNFTEFMVRLNGGAAAIGKVTVLDTVADLYRTSIHQVESVLEMVEYLTDMISEEDKLNAIKRIIIQRYNTVHLHFEPSVLETIIESQKELINLLQNIFERAGNMSEHKDGNPFINVATSGSLFRFVDPEYWAEILQKQTELLVKDQTYMLKVQLWRFVHYKVGPVIVAIVFAVGMTGNGILLTIFVRHKETRTLANSMLINLTVVDLLSLIVNVLLHYLMLSMTWQLGLFVCKLYFFFSYLLTAVSTYSVAMISVQRYVAVRQLSSLVWCHQSQKKKYVLMVIVWGIGCTVSVPRGVAPYTEHENCYPFTSGNGITLVTSELITLCVVPLLITAVFSGLTAYRIRRSAREIPGEATGQQQLQHSRIVSSTVLFALTLIFVVSNVPFFLFQFLNRVFNISISYGDLLLVATIAHYIRFANCCLNPIVLIVISKQYRGYIKRYCGQH